jgi:biopolymer transport protein ExbD
MMVIAPLLDQQGLNLTVPTQHEAKKQEKQPKLITVNVSKDGQYTVDGQEVAENNLQVRIEEVFKEKKDGLLIRADQDSTHGAVVLVMDAAQQVGIQNVSVMEN